MLVVDLDPQASSTWVLGHEASDGVGTVADVLAGGALDDSIVPSRWDDALEVLPGSAATAGAADREGTARLRAALAALPPDRYDAILLDCPPTLGGSTLSGLTVARHALIVVDPTALGLRGIGAVADAVDGVWDGDNPDLDLCAASSSTASRRCPRRPTAASTSSAGSSGAGRSGSRRSRSASSSTRPSASAARSTPTAPVPARSSTPSTSCGASCAPAAVLNPRTVSLNRPDRAGSR